MTCYKVIATICALAAFMQCCGAFELMAASARVTDAFVGFISPKEETKLTADGLECASLAECSTQLVQVSLSLSKGELIGDGSRRAVADSMKPVGFQANSAANASVNDIINNGRPASVKTATALFETQEFRELLGLNSLSAVEASVHAPVHRDGIMHFCFMVRDKFPNAAIWTKFFADAPLGSYRVWIHCHADCDASAIPSGIHAIVVPTVASKRCSDLVKPMVQLIRFARLLDGTAHDKFMFLSETTLPVKTFAMIHASLTTDANSSFCFWPEDSWPRTSMNAAGNRYYLPRTHQWSVFNVQHARNFYHYWASREEGHSIVPVRTETSWSGINRSLFKDMGRYYTCADESDVFASVVGAVRHNSIDEIVMDNLNISMRCHTFVHFATTSTPGSELFRNADFQFRKFEHAIGGHPMMFRRVDARILDKLRQSSFLFARKFKDQIDSELYSDRVFAVAKHARAGM